MTLRLRARLPRAAPVETPLPSGAPDPSSALLARRSVVFDEAVETPVYGRERLLAGNVIEGPAVVAQMDSTTLVPPGWRAGVDRHANLVLETS
jgi:N-methylhydantoinase A